MEVIILIGLQGAGKSTFHQRRFAATHAYVSRDRLRKNRRPRSIIQSHAASAEIGG
jgi:predicted kinase